MLGCWAAGWDELGFGQGEEKEREKWAEPRGERRELSLFSFFLVFISQIKFKFESI
jgi:hypothetical protein